MAFQGLLYTASADHLAMPLVSRDNMSVVSLSSDLLEEVKDVLIPAEMLRIEYAQIIGKGATPSSLLPHVLPFFTSSLKVLDVCVSRSLWDSLSWTLDRQQKAGDPLCCEVTEQ